MFYVTSSNHAFMVYEGYLKFDTKQTENTKSAERLVCRLVCMFISQEENDLAL